MRTTFLASALLLAVAGTARGSGDLCTNQGGGHICYDDNNQPIKCSLDERDWPIATSSSPSRPFLIETDGTAEAAMTLRFRVGEDQWDDWSSGPGAALPGSHILGTTCGGSVMAPRQTPVGPGTSHVRHPYTPDDGSVSPPPPADAQAPDNQAYVVIGLPPTAANTSLEFRLAATGWDSAVVPNDYELPLLTFDGAYANGVSLTYRKKSATTGELHLTGVATVVPVALAEVPVYVTWDHGLLTVIAGGQVLEYPLGTAARMYVGNTGSALVPATVHAGVELRNLTLHGVPQD